jgi:hypothetical protein
MLHTNLSSRDGTIGQLVADVPTGLGLIPPQETKKKKIYLLYLTQANRCPLNFKELVLWKMGLSFSLTTSGVLMAVNIKVMKIRSKSL